MMMQIDTELDIVKLAQTGNRDAFAQLASHYRVWLLAMAFMRTSDHDVAEDLVQEVFIRAWEKLPSLKNPEAFTGWLRRIMINACSTWYRGQENGMLPFEEIQEVAPTSTEPVNIIVAHEQQRALREALLSLAPDNRLALLMHIWGNYSYADIARLLDIPESTVDGRIYRSKQQMRRLLQNKYADLFNRENGEKL
jgi:RNA polymerase sigma-70 factor (ECF subfamily)